MRDPRTIELEIDVARHDLEASLSELKEVVREKLDVKKRAREAVDQRKQQAWDLAQRGKRELLGLVQRVRIVAAERPQLALLATAGLFVLGFWFARHRMRAA